MEQEPNILAKAKTRLSALESQKAHIDAEVQELQQFITLYNKLQNGKLNEHMPEKVSKRTKGDIAVESAIELHRQRNEPVKTSDIVDLMKKKGAIIDSDTPIVVVSGYLSKAENLESIRGQGWIEKR